MTEPITLQSLIAQRRNPPTTRLLNGALHYYAFMRWKLLAGFEEEHNFPEDSRCLFFGLGSEARAQKLITMGEGHRLYEPDPHRIAIFQQQNPDFFSENNWKVGTGLWFEDGFFEKEVELVNQPLLNLQLKPLPQMLKSWCKNGDAKGNWLIVQTGGLFFQDIVDSLTEEDQIIFPLNMNTWQRSALEFFLTKKEPTRVFSVNVIDGMADLAQDCSIKYTSWEIDPATSPYSPINKESNKATRIFTYRKKNIPELKQAGYKYVEHLRLASRPETRKPLNYDKIDKKYRADISFVGSSMKKNASRLIEQVTKWALSQRQEGRVGEWQEFQHQLNRWITTPPEWNENSIQVIEKILNKLNIPLYDFIDNEPMRVAMAIAEQRAYLKRAQVVETVGNHYPIKVWGDPDWKKHLGKHGNYRGQAGHQEELTKIYNGSLINLDINRIYQPDIITMRVFDVMCTGNIVLTEHSKELLELFKPGTHCVTYKKETDLLKKIKMLLEKPELRKSIGVKARKKILKKHRIKDRLNKINLLEHSG